MVQDGRFLFKEVVLPGQTVLVLITLPTNFTGQTPDQTLSSVLILTGLTAKLYCKNMTHPFGLDVHNGFIYWTDWTSKDIRRAKINDPSSLVVLRSGLEGLMEIRVYDSATQKGGSHIAHCRNARGLGKSMIIVGLFEKLRY